MVSARCILAVKATLKKLGLHFIIVELGEIDILENLSDEQRELLRASLHASGLELMDDKRALLISKIKQTIHTMVYHSDETPKINNADFFATIFSQDYTHLANLFSEVQGITIEQYTISLRVERIKELIMYGELSISEIAWKMNYSSVSHLSNQFKKVTGLTPTHYKNFKEMRQQQVESLIN
jgi:AraC-like DNA-binding protein